MFYILGIHVPSDSIGITKKSHIMVDHALIKYIEYTLFKLYIYTNTGEG